MRIRSLNASSTTTVTWRTILTSTTTVYNSSVQFLRGGGGPGQLYMSENEVIGLIGGTGERYIVIYDSDPSHYEFGMYTGNTTGSWSVGYTFAPNFTTTKVIGEFVYKSQKAKYLYDAQLASFLANETVGADNSTLDGLTYSTISWDQNGSRGSKLMGYKNDIMVSAIAPYELNRTDLASVIANDIP